MSAKKVRICGWVDKKLKAEFLKHCRVEALSQKGSAKLSQSKLLEIFLMEGINERKRQRRER